MNVSFRFIFFVCVLLSYTSAQSSGKYSPYEYVPTTYSEDHPSETVTLIAKYHLLGSRKESGYGDS